MTTIHTSQHARPPGLAAARALLVPVRPLALAELVARYQPGRRIAQIAPIYQHFFPQEWRGGQDLRHGPPSPGVVRALVERLIGLIDDADLLPIDRDWLMIWESDGHDSRDADESDGAWPPYLDSLPVDLGHGFDREGWLDTDGHSAAEILLGEAAFAVGVDHALWAAVAAEDTRLYDRVWWVREQLADVRAVDRLASDAVGAFAALPGALRHIPTFARFLQGETGNRCLDADPTGISRFYDLPWTLAAVQGLAREWSDARVILSRVGDVEGALHGNLAPILAAIEATVDEHATRYHDTKGRINDRSR